VAGTLVVFTMQPKLRKSGYWYADGGYRFEVLAASQLAFYLNFQPGQCVALHAGERLQGGKTDGD
jgi:hypothetical protein